MEQHNENHSCIVCGSQVCGVLGQMRCQSTGADLHAAHCKKCGLIFLDPAPAAETGIKYFDDNYGGRWQRRNKYYYQDHKRILQRNALRFKMLQQLNVPGKKVLDFGAGQGHFVKIARENGWDAVGVERSVQGRKSARATWGMELLDSLDGLESSARFDVITLWDVIEHLEDPIRLLKQLRCLQSATGVLLVETGNTDSVNFLVDPPGWSLWNIDHRFYFNHHCLSLALTKAGYEQVELLFTPRTSRNWMGMLQSALSLKKLHHYFRRQSLTRSRMEIHGSVGDLITVYARNGS